MLCLKDEIEKDGTGIRNDPSFSIPSFRHIIQDNLNIRIYL